MFDRRWLGIAAFLIPLACSAKEDSTPCSGCMGGGRREKTTGGGYYPETVTPGSTDVDDGTASLAADDGSILHVRRNDARHASSGEGRLGAASWGVVIALRELPDAGAPRDASADASADGGSTDAEIQDAGEPIDAAELDATGADPLDVDAGDAGTLALDASASEPSAVDAGRGFDAGIARLGHRRAEVSWRLPEAVGTYDLATIGASATICPKRDTVMGGLDGVDCFDLRGTYVGPVLATTVTGTLIVERNEATTFQDDAPYAYRVSFETDRGRFRGEATVRGTFDKKNPGGYTPSYTTCAY